MHDATHIRFTAGRTCKHFNFIEKKKKTKIRNRNETQARRGSGWVVGGDLFGFVDHAVVWCGDPHVQPQVACVPGEKLRTANCEEDARHAPKT